MAQGVKTISCRMIVLAVIVLSMAGCAETPPLPPNVNTLDVLGPGPEFADAVGKRTLPVTCARRCWRCPILVGRGTFRRRNAAITRCA